MTHEADILIVTVTKVETSATLQAFEPISGVEAKPLSIEDRIYFDLGTINKARIFLTQSEMGSGGLGASLLTVRKGIEDLFPTAVIMVGIAFGVNEEKQAIGDILVTEQLRLYDLQRVGTQDEQEQVILRGDKPHASPWLINLFKSADISWEKARVRFGTVLTGEKLLDNIDYRNQLLSFEPEAIGGEMEGAGLYVACQDKKVDWILVKGICDWADGEKGQDKESRQKTAASNAAAFVVHTLEFVLIDWEQRRGNGLQSSETSGIMTDRDMLQPALAMAKRSLGILEVQAAGYGTLQIPAHLQIDLEQKRREVKELEARLIGRKFNG
jgi:nucleoside phosphorylase